MSDIKHWASDIHVNGSEYDYDCDYDYVYVCVSVSEYAYVCDCTLVHVYGCAYSMCVRLCMSIGDGTWPWLKLVAYVPYYLALGHMLFGSRT